MTVQDMLDSLALRLEDPEKRKFTDYYKLKALENAQVIVAQLLNNNYLTELQVIDSDKPVSSGTVSLSSLSNRVLRGAEGILNVKNHGGLFCAMLNMKDVKKTENSYLQGSTKNPMAWKFANAVRLLPADLTAVDVYYLKQPSSLQYAFGMSEHASPSPTAFVGNDGQNLSSTDDYYNGSLIYCIGKRSYHVVTDYAGSTRTFTVSPAASTNFGTDTFYFVATRKYNFHLTNLSEVTCDLDASLHDVVVTLAEAECWKMANKLDRTAAALKKAIDTIVTLNDRYEAPEGIGTDGRRERR